MSSIMNDEDKFHQILDGADAALTIWRAIVKGDPYDEDESDIMDCIADLTHLAQEKGDNGTGTLYRAGDNFIHERDGIDCLPFDYTVRKHG